MVFNRNSQHSQRGNDTNLVKLFTLQCERASAAVPATEIQNDSLSGTLGKAGRERRGFCRSGVLLQACLVSTSASR